MATTEHDPMPSSQRLFDPFLSFNLHQSHHLLDWHRVKSQEVEYVPTETAEGLMGNHSALGKGTVWKCSPHVCNRGLSPPVVETTKHRTQAGTKRPKPAPWDQPYCLT
tara:strand:- start:55 stop:378 length:324 start_codon:yes stop_codon:yes gene_type:complete